MTQFEELLRTLVREGVEFVVIGGLAANIHGVTIPTYDIDICYDRSYENLKRLSSALKPYHPTLRGAPANLPFRLDPETLKAGLNFTLETDLGNLDLLGEVGGVGWFKDVKGASSEVRVREMQLYVLGLAALIKAKKFAGRKKDEMMILELEAIQELLEKKRK